MSDSRAQEKSKQRKSSLGNIFKVSEKKLKEHKSEKSLDSNFKTSTQKRRFSLNYTTYINNRSPRGKSNEKLLKSFSVPSKTNKSPRKKSLKKTTSGELSLHHRVDKSDKKSPRTLMQVPATLPKLKEEQYKCASYKEIISENINNGIFCKCNNPMCIFVRNNLLRKDYLFSSLAIKFFNDKGEVYFKKMNGSNEFTIPKESCEYQCMRFNLKNMLGYFNIDPIDNNTNIDSKNNTTCYPDDITINYGSIKAVNGVVVLSVIIKDLSAYSELHTTFGNSFWLPSKQLIQGNPVVITMQKEKVIIDQVNDIANVRFKSKKIVWVASIAKHNYIY